MNKISLPQLNPREAAREAQCEHRTGGGCIEVSRRVGWDVSVAIDWCDSCHASGRPDGRLEEVARRIVERHARPEMRRHLDREVLEVLRDRHGVPVSLGEVAMASDRKQRWKNVRLTWENAKSLALSATSRLVFGRIAEERMQARLGQCRRCPARRESGGGEFCGVCGCGDTQLARLDSKLKYPSLKCPLGRFA